MKTECSLSFWQKSATCDYNEHCCVTAEGNGGLTYFTTVRTKPVVIIHDMESLVVINISEYWAAAMCIEHEVQVFPKQLKHLTNLQCVQTRKQLFIEPIPNLSMHT